MEGQELCGKYQKEVLERAGEPWLDDDSVARRWDVVRTALTSAAEEVLGTTTRHQPDWFQESLDQLQPLLNSRNEAYTKWLGSGKQANLTKLKVARGKKLEEQSGMLRMHGSCRRLRKWRENGLEEKSLDVHP